MEKIQVCYYPTTAVFIDNHQPFLDSLTLVLDDTIAYRLFRQPQTALDYINDKNRYNPLRSENCIVPDDEDLLYRVRLNIDLIKNKVKDRKRFLEPSVVIIDYDIPELNGLEFCQAIDDPYIKKVLLTGVADEHIGIEAFNDNIIDYYIKKDTPDISQRINQLIPRLQQQYFINISQTIREDLKVSCQFMDDSALTDYFSCIINDNAIAEYYFQYDYMHSPLGFLMVTYTGDVHQLIIYDDETLEAQLEIAIDAEAPEALINQLRLRHQIPWFPTEDGFYDAAIPHWQHRFYPVDRIEGKQTYYCAFILEPLIFEFNTSMPDILSFQDHLMGKVA